MKKRYLKNGFRKMRIKDTKIMVAALLIAIFAITGLAVAITGTSSVSGGVYTGKPAIVGGPVKPIELNIDLRTLPGEKPWKEGEPIKEIPAPKSPFAIGEPIQGQTSNFPQATASPQVTNPTQAANSISPPAINIEGIVADGYLPPDTIGDVGPNNYIQAVNVRFAIFDKSGNVLVGKSGSVVGGININQLWIDAGLSSDPCGINSGSDPIVKYDRLADRWVISDMVPFSNFCVAVSRTSNPVTGGWFLYDFPTNGLINDYPKLGVWPDAYYVGTNNGNGGGNAWAFDRTNMTAGGVAQAPIVFSYVGFMLPSDLYGTVPPAGAPNVFARFAPGANQLRLSEFHADFGNPAASTFNALPNLPTNPYNSIFCGVSGGMSAKCIPQPKTGQKLDVLNGVLMYRMQYRNFVDHETLVLEHDINVGNNQAGVRWYELRKSGGIWSIYQQGTHAPDNTTNRWMGSLAMDKNGNISLGYSVSSKNVFPGIRYTGRLSTDTLGMLQAESTLINGGGSQTPTPCMGGPCGNRWGDYSSMTVDPIDDCTFWYTTEYYPTSSPGGWHTRIGSFGYCHP